MRCIRKFFIRLLGHARRVFWIAVAMTVMVFSPAIAQAPATSASAPAVVFSSPSFEILADSQQARHLRTGLIWQRCPLGTRWAVNQCVADELACRRQTDWGSIACSLTHAQAQTLAQQQAKKTGLKWRLPTLHELMTLTLFELHPQQDALTAQPWMRQHARALDVGVFPLIRLGVGSSTAMAGHSQHHWHMTVNDHAVRWDVSTDITPKEGSILQWMLVREAD